MGPGPARFRGPWARVRPGPWALALTRVRPGLGPARSMGPDRAQALAHVGFIGIHFWENSQIRVSGWRGSIRIKKLVWTLLGRASGLLPEAQI